MKNKMLGLVLIPIFSAICFGQQTETKKMEEQSKKDEKTAYCDTKFPNDSLCREICKAYWDAGCMVTSCTASIQDPNKRNIVFSCGPLQYGSCTQCYIPEDKSGTVVCKTCFGPAPETVFERLRARARCFVSKLRARRCCRSCCN